MRRHMRHVLSAIAHLDMCMSMYISHVYVHFHVHGYLHCDTLCCSVTSHIHVWRTSITQHGATICTVVICYARQFRPGARAHLGHQVLSTSHPFNMSFAMRRPTTAQKMLSASSGSSSSSSSSSSLSSTTAGRAGASPVWPPCTCLTSSMASGDAIKCTIFQGLESVCI